MKLCYRLVFLIFPCLLFHNTLSASNIPNNTYSYVSFDIFGKNYFIKNEGQFDSVSKNFKTDFALLNGEESYYIYKTGLRIDLKKYIFNEKEEKKKHGEREAEDKFILKQKPVFLSWINCNPNSQVYTFKSSPHYFTGSNTVKAIGYKKVMYKDIYPNIDLEYTIPDSGGIKFSFILHPGANINSIQYTYSGAGLQMEKQETQIQLNTKVQSLSEKGLRAEYEDGTPVQIHYNFTGKQISYSASILDTSKTLIIDPWLQQISLSGTGNAINKGFDVDYDLDGNLYVYGGDGCIAKYNTKGQLIWTFLGVVNSIGYSPGSCIGNFVVEKNSGKVYTGQGFDPSGAIIIRLDSSGFYDNFGTNKSYTFQEVWEMNYDCALGSIFGMGGSTTSNLNFGKFSSGGNFTPVNITQINGFYQDILSSSQNSNGELFVILSSINNTPVNNLLIRLDKSYTNPIWKQFTGRKTFVEANNKPFARSGCSNGYNALSANNSFVFVYDGRCIQAHDIKTGAFLGKDSISSQVVKFQGGIFADACNTIYLGGDSLNIHVFHFDGSKFTKGKTIYLKPNSNLPIYDIKFHPGSNHLYYSGQGIVGTYEIKEPCLDTISLPMTITTDCDLKTAIVNLKINKDSLEIYYIWKDLTDTSAVVRQTRNRLLSDTLSMLVKGHTYSIQVIKSPLCNLASSKLEFEMFDTSLVNTVSSLCKGDTLRVKNKIYTKAGLYLDTFTNQGKCIKYSSLRIIEYAPSSFFQSVQICFGDSFQIGNLFHKTAGQFVQVLLNSKGCDSTVTSIISIVSSQEKFLNKKLCLGDSFVFGNHIYTIAGEYIDTLKSISDCDTLVHIKIEVIASILCSCERGLRMPNVFTPNDDEVNTYFPDLYFEGMQLKIYNRWGKLLFDNNEGKGWDGKYGAELAPDGTYYYMMEYVDCHFLNQKIWGCVRLIRD